MAPSKYSPAPATHLNPSLGIHHRLFRRRHARCTPILRRPHVHVLVGKGRRAVEHSQQASHAAVQLR